MPLPEYRYGKVTGTYPDLTVVSERSETPMVCCGYCSAHMACITSKAGLSNLMTNEAHAIRRMGGRPHNYGSRASELRAGAKAALGVTLMSVAIEDIPDRLRKGFAVEVAIQYAKLAGWLKVQTNDFGHSVLLFGWQEANNRAGFFDPLWSQGARGAWAPWTTIKAALWENGNHNTTTVKRVPTTPTGGTDVGIFFNPARWTLTKDVPVYLESGCTTKITTLKAGATVTTIGELAKKEAAGGDGRDPSKRAVLVKTGGLVEGTGDTAQEAILWVKDADLPDNSVPTQQAWDDSIWRLALDPNGRYPAPASPPANCDEAIASRDAEWEKAIKGGEPWPGQ